MADCLDWGVERWVPARMPGARWGRRVPVPVEWRPSAMPCQWPAVQYPVRWVSPWRGFAFAIWPGAALGSAVTVAPSRPFPPPAPPPIVV